MDAARVTGIATGVTVQARMAATGEVAVGDWRTIAENGVVNHREELLIEADTAKYEFTACTLQKRVAGVWTAALSLTLDLPTGSSHFRKDRLAVAGDETNSTVAVTTIDKGDRDLKEALRQLRLCANGRFTLQDGTTKFKGIADALEHATRGEMGGFEQDYKGLIIADRQQFEEEDLVPTSKMKLTWGNGRTYRVVSVKEDAISYEIEVTSVNK